jgi:diaminohydroxyphosphoribosylaminopyrimidine deaminase/5-amino-6-(5-phosphoribosylamino)uracil reductase
VSALSPEDQRWLDAAARFAAPFTGTTADNPAVGALIVDPNTQRLIARAVTARGGRPHAEAQAIAQAGFQAAGCTLYLTMEPCYHWGRTPPCVDAIIRAGIMRVVIGAADPDPRVAGGSVALLESAGVEAIIASHAPSLALHAGHILRHTIARPRVTALVVTSADGMVARKGEGRGTPEGDLASAWISMARALSDAVMIGGSTAKVDDPALTVSLPDMATRTPVRVILAGADGVDCKLNLIGGFSGYRTTIIAENDAEIDAPVSVEVIRVAGEDGRPDLLGALGALAQRHVQNLLIEPGPRLLAALLEADLVDRLALVETSQLVGDAGIPASADGLLADLLDAAGLVEVETQPLGNDKLSLFERPPRSI